MTLCPICNSQIEEGALVCPVCGADAACEIQQAAVERAKDIIKGSAANFFKTQVFLALNITITALAALNILVAIIDLVFAFINIGSIMVAIFASISAVACWKLYRSTNEAEGTPIYEKIKDFSLFYRFSRVMGKIAFVCAIIVAVCLGLSALILLAAEDVMQSVTNELIQNAGSYGLDAYTVQVIEDFRDLGAVLIAVLFILLAVVVVVVAFNYKKVYIKSAAYVNAMLQTTKTAEYQPPAALPFLHCYIFGGIVAAAGVYYLFTDATGGLTTIATGAFIIVSGLAFNEFHKAQLPLKKALDEENEKLLSLQKRTTAQRAQTGNTGYAGAQTASEDAGPQSDGKTASASDSSNPEPTDSMNTQASA